MMIDACIMLCKFKILHSVCFNALFVLGIINSSLSSLFDEFDPIVCNNIV